MAVFKVDGTWPAWREWLITEVIRGLMAEMWVLTRAVGKGSREQVEGFILAMRASTSRWEVLTQQRRGWGIPGCGEEDQAGGVGEWESAERMFETFDLKASRKRLHVSSVMSLWVGGCGFRRLFIVEKSCLEFPGLLFMMLE